MHLIRRFLGFLAAKPLTPAEQSVVTEILDPALARAFFAQRSEDQRHAFDVRGHVDGHEHLYEAALLHDVGKTASDLGAIPRSLATIWSRLGLATTGRWSEYLNHGEIGALELEALGAGDLAVAFARNHPGTTPPGIDHDSWHLLGQADDA